MEYQANTAPADPAAVRPNATGARSSDTIRGSPNSASRLEYHPENLGTHGGRFIKYYGGNTRKARQVARKKYASYRKLHNKSPIGENKGSSGKLAFECRLCKGSFVSLQKVSSHLAAKEWRLAIWYCSDPSCGKVYKWPHDLRRHQKRSHSHISAEPTPVVALLPSIISSPSNLTTRNTASYPQPASSLEDVYVTANLSAYTPLLHAGNGRRQEQQQIALSARSTVKPPQAQVPQAQIMQKDFPSTNLRSRHNQYPLSTTLQAGATQPYPVNLYSTEIQSQNATSYPSARQRTTHQPHPPNRQVRPIAPCDWDCWCKADNHFPSVELEGLNDLYSPSVHEVTAGYTTPSTSAWPRFVNSVRSGQPRLNDSGYSQRIESGYIRPTPEYGFGNPFPP